jgi:hypothetical protein
MVNAMRHGLLYPNRTNIQQHNKRIGSLPSIAGTTLRAHFASLKMCAHKVSGYVGCHMPEVFV